MESQHWIPKDDHCNFVYNNNNLFEHKYFLAMEKGYNERTLKYNTFTNIY
jgi:hypothetical protein